MKLVLILLAIMMASASVHAAVNPIQLYDLTQNPLKYVPTRSEEHSEINIYTFAQDKDNFIKLFFRNGKTQGFLLKLFGRYKEEFFDNVLVDREMIFSENFIKGFTINTYRVKSGIFDDSYFTTIKAEGEEETFSGIFNLDYYDMDAWETLKLGDAAPKVLQYLYNKKDFCEISFIKCFK